MILLLLCRCAAHITQLICSDEIPNPGGISCKDFTFFLALEAKCYCELGARRGLQLLHGVRSHCSADWC